MTLHFIHFPMRALDKIIYYMLYSYCAEVVRLHPHGPPGMVDASRSISNPAVFLCLTPHDPPSLKLWKDCEMSRKVTSLLLIAQTTGIC